MDILNTVDRELTAENAQQLFEAEVFRFAKAVDTQLGIDPEGYFPSPVYAREYVELVPEIKGFEFDQSEADRLGVAAVRNVETNDHITQANPSVFEASNSLLRTLAEFANANGETRSKRKITDPNKRNKSTQLLAQLPVLDEWLQTIPSAFALEPLYDSSKLAMLSPPFEELNNEHKRNFLYAQTLIENCVDGLGIRSRGAITQQAISEVAESFGKEEPIQILSLAAGAGVSIFRQAAALLDDGFEVDLVLVDTDPDVLELARHNAAELGLVEGRDITFIEADIMDDEIMDVALGGKQFHIVEAIGIEEYFPKRLASKLVSSMVGRTRVGGEAIFANMTDANTREDLDFTLKVVDWPYIRPRQAEEAVQIVSEAGVDVSTNLEVVTTSDKLYNLYRVKS